MLGLSFSPRGWWGTERAPQGSGHNPNPARAPGALGQRSRHRVGLLRLHRAGPGTGLCRSPRFPSTPEHSELPGWPCTALPERWEPARPWGGAGRPQVRGAAGGGPEGGRGSPRDARARPHLRSGVGARELRHRARSRHHACQRRHQVHQVPALRLQLHLLGEAPRAVAPRCPAGSPQDGDGGEGRGRERTRREPHFVCFSGAWFLPFSLLAPPPEGEGRVPVCSRLYFFTFFGFYPKAG